MSISFQPDEAAKGLLADMTESLTANSLSEADIVTSEAKSVALPYRVSFQAEFGWKWEWEVYPGHQLRGNAVRDDAEAVAGIKTWAEQQIASEDIIPLLLSKVGDDVPTAYKRFSSPDQSIKSIGNGWSYSCNCANCRGRGNLSCATCAGTGGMHCYHCSGQGQQTCSSCGGSGIIGYGSNATRCGGCWGGLVDCWACTYGRYGRGRLQCHTCGGDGLLNCQPCNATGAVTYIYSAHITVVAKGLSIEDATPGMPPRHVALGPYADDAGSIVNSARSSKTLYKATYAVTNSAIAISQKATVRVRLASITTKGATSALFEAKELPSAGIWFPGTAILDIALKDELELAKQDDPIAALNAARRTRVGRRILADSVGSKEYSDPADKIARDEKYISPSFASEWKSLLEKAYEKIPQRVINRLWLGASIPLCFILLATGYLQLFSAELTALSEGNHAVMMLLYGLSAIILIFIVNYVISGIALADIRRHIPEAKKTPPLTNTAKAAMCSAFLCHVLGLWLGQ